MSSPRYALIVDIVRSREIADRAAAQAAVHGAFARAHDVVPLAEPLWATVGDEFQAVARTLPAALWTATVARLLLPDGLDLRVGIGRGETRDVARDGTGPAIKDGSAWWAARDAIDEAHRRSDRKESPWVRTWYLDAPRGRDAGTRDAGTQGDGRQDAGDAAQVALVDAQLLVLDRMIDSMTSPQRAYAGASALGRTQAQVAAAHDVTQPAVSQGLRRSGGAALVAALALLEEVAG